MSNKIKELRDEFGLSVRQLEFNVQIDKSTITKLENGVRHIHTNHIEPFCRFFDVTSDYLLGRTKIGINVWFYDETSCMMMSEDEVQELYDAKELELIETSLFTGKKYFRRVLSKEKSLEMLSQGLEEEYQSRKELFQLLKVLCGGHTMLYSMIKDLIIIDNVDDTKLKMINDIIQMVKNTLPKE